MFRNILVSMKNIYILHKDYFIDALTYLCDLYCAERAQFSRTQQFALFLVGFVLCELCTLAQSPSPALPAPFSPPF